MKSHHHRSAWPYVLALVASATLHTTLAHASALIVAEDRGGSSALPYYEALKLQAHGANLQSLRIEVPRPPAEPFSEADMLPVRSTRLSPGEVPRRTIEAPGLPPFFIVGDDAHSHDWLRQRAAHLRELGAMGLVVNVNSTSGLAALRALAPDLTLAPTPGDDLAARLGLHHYPALITATGIEQ
ncbi:integrating conjugative element protein [Pseudomonas putida]|jgi:integrating conjugative element protein (TIGR03765 family)|uniref:integrating conjugative element protein n=1 Tax=Pseudomonas putida TaxID=303 RepID=UPI000C2B2031|nr:integrating conjugative element protein [Pseudomonas putida]MBF8160946.1 integrating conjugative element protein [Pseudomonas mendocina]PJX08596.1 integrating conjugative element protein [Pseudomonas putida]HCF5435875.1 integrating conjugative element protein [Pseudomonas aeruginosa]